MSKNIDQVFIANPITSNASTDLMYFGQSPYGVGNDAAMTYSNFSAQFVKSTAILDPAHGGTGVNNGTNTITIGGNLSTQSSFQITGNSVLFTAPFATALSLPASGTLATTSLAGSGTGASLVASAGSIVYSTASAMAFSAVGSSGQLLSSTGTTAPVWTTATYPSTTTINQILYSSANNTIGGITTANNGTLITSAGGVPSISSTLPTAVQGNITQLGVQSQALNMNNNQINNVATPTSANDAVNKQYADNIASGLNPIEGVEAATTANLTATYNNGVAGVGATLTNSGALAAFSVDGVSTLVGYRILIKNQTSTFQNGLYTVTTVGDGISVPWVLTRATDYNVPSEIQIGDLIAVQNGTVNIGSSWLQTAVVNTIGTDAIIFSAFFLPSNFISSTLSNGTILIGNVSNIATQSSSKWPSTTTANQLLYSSSTNTVSGLTSANGGVLVTSNTGVPSILAGSGSTGTILQATSGGTPAWSTPTYPSASGTAGLFLRSDGTNNVYSTSTIPTSAGATANKVLLSDGTNYVLSTPTFPNASATSGKIIKSDGTNWTASTETYASPGTSGNLMTSDGTNWTSTAPTKPTLQIFTSGSGTYNLPAGCKYIEVEMCGGGGGGAGSGTSPGAAGNGGNTTFGSSFLTANGGAKGATTAVATGGTATGGDINIAGANTSNIGGATNQVGGTGANSPFGGGGAQGGLATAATAATGYGSGGGGAGCGLTASAGGGGAAGGYVYKLITSPNSTYSYAVGAVGTAGTAGTSGFAGGAGASGIIIVTEHYI